MGRLFRNIRSTVTPSIFFVPFTFYFFLFADALFIANLLITSTEVTPGSSFTYIFRLLVKAGVWFLLIIIAVGFVSVLVSYSIFVWKKKSNKIQFSVSTINISEITENPMQKIR